MSKHKSKIPPLPGDDATPAEVTAYYEQYSAMDLIEAGHMSPVEKEDYPDIARVQAAARAELAKRKRAQLNIALTESELAELESYAKEVHIPTSTIAKSWILRALKAEKLKLSTTNI